MPARRHKPTDKQRIEVESYSAVGLPQADIARLMGITLPTLHKYYREELDLGMAKANAQVAKTLFKEAIKGNMTACIFWMKARAGWREKQEIVVSGSLQLPNEETLGAKLDAVLASRQAGSEPSVH